MFPILLDLRGKLVCVIGGGAVGSRKTRAAVDAGASVRVVDPQVTLSLPDPITHITELYRAEHLEGATLVFACATPEVNTRVVADAHQHGIWVNAASSPDAGDFTLPAVVRRGGLTLAVSTEGASPALARRIREKLESEFDNIFAVWVQILAEVRTEVLATVADEVRRRELLDSFADWSWLTRLRAEGTEAVRQAMRACL
ncbi:siroheme synthase : Siroheme synthase OS=Thermincola potens (strain JR) GN=TherJR_1133 PE=4 SV=1: NAD_binding_7: Sirohm_synth_M [Gemmata massiliana]|uniref:precorrin-2 dehydrogenase n=1 Tax=Gemmata massiliana TaxID=1210884 RepID=A0A6P2CT40_9BACT|nr:bifunctional precorrin-2 dehydrogenase/sirohydrochlorin ferrochelatase [Gemmata massiliana]VTR91265.1 siroheme synthase : Siroheme synthase OS=Thermincola potens (strain JR) GN=TherJR_1133 PE=4 SV=1: NAD_binding_7: Sirohm_synth_M [Gemmata massiliana]